MNIFLSLFYRFGPLFLLFCSSLAFSAPAQRIAVAGGSITEIIYRLGEEDRIVGVDSTSQFPAAAAMHPIVGYVRNVSVEGVLSLRPDLLIGEPDAGPTKIINQIKAAGVDTFIIEEDDSIDKLKQKIQTVAKLLNAQTQGDALLADIQYDLDALSFAKQRISSSPRVLFLLTLGNGAPIAAGHTTSAHTAIIEAGGINVLEQYEGWEKLSPEATLGLNPDVIVVMNRDENIKSEVKKFPHFKFSNAVKNNAVYTIDGAYLLGFGPRTPQAFVELGTMIHPHFPLPENYQFRYANSAGVKTTGH